MVTESASDKPDILHLGYSSSGSICTRLNRKLQLFVSPVPDPEAYATDALNLSWMSMWAYASLSSHSLMSEKDSERGMHSLSDSTTLGGTGVVSSFNGHSSSTSTPSKEGSIVSTCIQNVATHPPGVPSSRLVALQQQMQAQALLSQLPDESIQRRDLPPTVCMITGGNLGWIGVSAGKWIPSILL